MNASDIIYFLAGAAVLILAVALVCRIIDSSGGEEKNGGGDGTSRGKPYEVRRDRVVRKNESGPLRVLFMPEQKRAGIRGEKRASRAIETVLRDEDMLFTGLRIEHEGSRAEFDNIVVNRYGVFIIEVKDWSGRLSGGIDDPEWKKTKITGAGNVYTKYEKNPVKQVNRQAGILARWLRSNGVNVWVRGFVLLLQGNSPVDDPVMLRDMTALERAIHTKDRKLLDGESADAIVRLLEG